MTTMFKDTPLPPIRILKSQQQSEKPPERDKTQILLGKTLDTNQDVSINQWDRRQSMYVIGKTGYGKSVFLSNMAIQDIQMGMGVCVIDPSGGDLLDVIIAHIPPQREQDVIYLDPLDTDYPFPFNLFSCADPTNVDLFQATVEQIVAV